MATDGGTTQAPASNAVFTRGFIPGLVVGLLVGLAVGAFYPALIGQPTVITPDPNAPKAPHRTPREEDRDHRADDPNATPPAATQPGETPAKPAEPAADTPATPKP